MRVALGLAIPLTLTDLAVKRFAATPQWAYHSRSFSWLVLCACLLAALILLVRVPSALVPPAAGILAAGVLGNGISAASSHDFVVPNPLVVTTDDATIAFNLADVFVTVGLLSLVPILARELIVHRLVIDAHVKRHRARRRG
jgi:lipoprotein signal peptidase